MKILKKCFLTEHDVGNSFENTIYLLFKRWKHWLNQKKNMIHIHLLDFQIEKKLETLAFYKFKIFRVFIKFYIEKRTEKPIIDFA